MYFRGFPMRKDGGDATHTMTQHLPSPGSENSNKEAAGEAKMAGTESQRTAIKMDADRGD